MKELKELKDLKELKNVFIAHCKELGCEANYIMICETKFQNVESLLIKYNELKREDEFLGEHYRELLAYSNKVDRVLQIIREKRVSTSYFIEVCKTFKKSKNKVWVWGHLYTSELEYYNHFLYEQKIGDPPLSAYKKRRFLTQEEFDLLKETLLHKSL